MSRLVTVAIYVGLALFAFALLVDDADDKAVRRCPSCGLEALAPQFHGADPRPLHWACGECGDYFYRGADGRFTRG